MVAGRSRCSAVAAGGSRRRPAAGAHRSSRTAARTPPGQSASHRSPSSSGSALTSALQEATVAVSARTASSSTASRNIAPGLTAPRTVMSQHHRLGRDVPGVSPPAGAPPRPPPTSRGGKVREAVGRITDHASKSGTDPRRTPSAPARRRASTPRPCAGVRAHRALPPTPLPGVLWQGTRSAAGTARSSPPACAGRRRHAVISASYSTLRQHTGNQAAVSASSTREFGRRLRWHASQGLVAEQQVVPERTRRCGRRARPPTWVAPSSVHCGRLVTTPHGHAGLPVPCCSARSGGRDRSSGPIDDMRFEEGMNSHDRRPRTVALV